MVSKRNRGRAPPSQIVFDGTDIFVEFKGVRIAKRGRADTEHARQWIPLEPGFTVYSNEYECGDDQEVSITVEHNGVEVQ